MRFRLDVKLERPACDLAVGREPDVGKLRKVLEDLVEHRTDQRPAAEMAIQGEAQLGRRLAQIEVVEGLLVDFPQHHRARPRYMAVGELAGI
jgi:hypothetical protein